MKRFFILIMAMAMAIAPLVGCVEQRQWGYTTTDYGNGTNYSTTPAPNYYSSTPNNGNGYVPYNTVPRGQVTTRYEHNSTDNSPVVMGAMILGGAALLSAPAWIRAFRHHGHHRHYGW